ncbi:MAG: undecaprenyl-diphosphate phosphatase [Chthoniobacteraceae bacterium]|nr:undecaprenyl-diphosphate phosphatase [Chthoniobacteraceae bacterium]
MTSWLVVVLLGMIEGLTEFIPVSSTGHLLLAEQWLPKQSELFNVVIQSGAMLALLPIFSRRLREMIFRFNEPENRDLVLKLAAAFFITGVGGVLMKKLGFVLPHDPMPIAWATLLGGFVIFGVERWIEGKQLPDRITWTVAIAIGLAQLIAAVFPGSSRSGTTIIMALAIGLNRPRATEFSFLLGIPTMFAAGALEIHHELKQAGGAHESWSLLLLGTAVSAVMAFIVVKWLIRFVQHNTFRGFAYYRVVMGGAMLLYFWPHKG